MTMSVKLRKTVTTVALAAILPALAACGGGGGGDDAPEPTPSGGTSVGEFIICGVLFMLIDGACVPKSGSSSSSTPSEPPPSEPPPADETDRDTWTLTYITELEPNNDLATAQPAMIATPAAGDEYGGFLLHGTINDQSDLTDVYIVTPVRSAEYGFRLCERNNGCDGGGTVDVVAAFFRVLDQDGKVLLTTQADELGANRAIMRFDAGIVYYITINAGDTMAVDLSYKLSFLEVAN